MDMFIKNDNKNRYELIFYSYKTDDYRTIQEYCRMLLTKLDLSTLSFKDQEYKSLINRIIDRNFAIEDYLERDFCKQNNMDEYFSDEFTYNYGSVESCESIDGKVFVEIRTKV